MWSPLASCAHQRQQPFVMLPRLRGEIFSFLLLRPTKKRRFDVLIMYQRICFPWPDALKVMMGLMNSTTQDVGLAVFDTSNKSNVLLSTSLVKRTSAKNETGTKTKDNFLTLIALARVDDNVDGRVTNGNGSIRFHIDVTAGVDNKQLHNQGRPFTTAPLVSSS